MKVFSIVRPVLVWSLFVFISSSPSFGEERPPMPETADSLKTISVPYAFYNEKFGAAVGYVHSVVGYPQKQAGLLGTAMAGSKGSGMAFLYGRDILVPGTERLLFDPIASIATFSTMKAILTAIRISASSGPAVMIQMKIIL